MREVNKLSIGGDELLMLRYNAKLSREKLAGLAGISSYTIERIESGQNIASRISTRKLRAAFAALPTSPDNPNPSSTAPTQPATPTDLLKSAAICYQLAGLYYHMAMLGELLGTPSSTEYQTVKG